MIRTVAGSCRGLLRPSPAVDRRGTMTLPPSPGGAEQRQRSAVVSVRLTAQELATAHAYAQVRGVSVSGAMRTTMLETASGAATRPTGTDGRATV